MDQINDWIILDGVVMVRQQLEMEGFDFEGNSKGARGGVTFRPATEDELKIIRRQVDEAKNNNACSVVDKRD